MKARKMLKTLQENGERVLDTDSTILIDGLWVPIQEAINELEALQHPKNCDGCKYEHKDAYSLPCAACVRNCDSDYYEPKEK